MQLEATPPSSWRLRVFPLACPVIKQSRLSLCFHEAGHAAVSLILGLPCAHARVCEAGGAFYYLPMVDGRPESACLNPEQVAEVLALAARVQKPKEIESSLTVDLVTMLAAGVQAELLLSGQPWAGQIRIMDQDTQQAMHLLVGGHPATLGFCQLRARALLTQQWAVVKGIADELFRKGEWSKGA